MDKKIKAENTLVAGWAPPLIIDFKTQKGQNDYQKLKSTGMINYVSDQIDDAVEELYHIEHPSSIDSVIDEDLDIYRKKLIDGPIDNYGYWIFYPWNGSFVHFPEKEHLRKLLSSRNRNLITEDERVELKNSKTILVAGLSVGSNVIDALLMQGIGSEYVLADMDSLDPTNLNRIRSSYDQLGVHKVDIVAKKISELDPFIEQTHLKNGLDESNLQEIIKRNKPNIIVDEMDSLRMKVILRLQAKKHGIPVLMATDNGDNILLDIERYDTDKNLPMLHGLLPDDIVKKILDDRTMSRRDAGKIIGRYFVGLDNVPIRMIESLMEVGKSLPSWPQLGGAAVLSGLYVTYAAKKILLNQPIRSGRFLMGPELQLDPSVSTDDYLAKKANLIKKILE
ncbi:ThiF family adenylyltransferase [Candidatus Saccharibacteria bacterium]|nr:ThiF family adenylyltransferase [Candidatus Saccharibacteria bacterium]